MGFGTKTKPFKPKAPSKPLIKDEDYGYAPMEPRTERLKRNKEETIDSSALNETEKQDLLKYYDDSEIKHQEKYAPQRRQREQRRERMFEKARNSKSGSFFQQVTENKK